VKDLREITAKRLFVEKITTDETFKNVSLERIKSYVFGKTGYQIEDKFIEETKNLREYFE